MNVDDVRQSIGRRRVLNARAAQFLGAFPNAMDAAFQAVGFRILRPAELQLLPGGRTLQAQTLRGALSMPEGASMKTVEYALQVGTDGHRLFVQQVGWNGRPRTWQYDKPVMGGPDAHAEDIAVWLLESWVRDINGAGQI